MNFGWNTGNDKYLPNINPKYNEMKNKLIKLRAKSKTFREARTNMRAEMKGSPANKVLKDIRKKASQEFKALSKEIIKYNKTIKKDN